MFYGCSYRHHLSGNNRRDSHINIGKERERKKEKERERKKEREGKKQRERKRGESEVREEREIEGDF